MKDCVKLIICVTIVLTMIGCSEIRGLKKAARQLSGKAGTEVRNCGCLKRHPNGRKIMSGCLNASSESECERKCRNQSSIGSMYNENGVCKY